MDIDEFVQENFAGATLIDQNVPLVRDQKYGFIWGDNVAINPFVIGYLANFDGVNYKFINCIYANTGEPLPAALNGRPRYYYKGVAGPFYNVDRVNQTGGKRKRQSRRLKKKGLRKRTKNRTRRT